MRSSMESFRNDVLNCDYDVIIISESWLQISHLNSELLPNGWSIYRKDRTLSSNKEDALGGGVFIAVKDTIPSSEVDLDTTHGDTLFDIVGCKLHLKGKLLFLSAFYFPPRASEENYSNLPSTISNLNSLLTSNDDIIIYGDANIPGIKWTPNEFQECLYDPVNINVNHYHFLTKVLSLGLGQTSNFKNQSDNVLDIILTNVISDFTLEKAILRLTKNTVNTVQYTMKYLQ